MSIRKSQQQQRAAIADFISPDNGMRGAMQRKGLQPKDHMKENRRIIRDAEFKNREIQEMEAQEPKELYKLSQFKNVAPRVYEPSSTVIVNTSRTNGASRNNSEVEYLTKGRAEQLRSELMEEKRAQRLALESELEEARARAADEISAPKAPVPRADEISKLAPRNNANFIDKNKTKAQFLLPPRPEQKGQPAKHESYGRVPEYLEERKSKALAVEEERRRNAPDPSCPPGMKLMSDEERISTLDVLNSSKEECEKQLSRLPFVVETATMKKKQQNLEQKLREIENALEIFNKPKVYIAMDS